MGEVIGLLCCVVWAAVFLGVLYWGIKVGLDEDQKSGPGGLKGVIIDWAEGEAERRFRNGPPLTKEPPPALFNQGLRILLEEHEDREQPNDVERELAREAYLKRIKELAGPDAKWDYPVVFESEMCPHCGAALANIVKGEGGFLRCEQCGDKRFCSECEKPLRPNEVKQSDVGVDVYVCTECYEKDESRF